VVRDFLCGREEDVLQVLDEEIRSLGDGERDDEKADGTGRQRDLMPRDEQGRGGRRDQDEFQDLAASLASERAGAAGGGWEVVCHGHPGSRTAYTTGAILTVVATRAGGAPVWRR